MATKSKTMTKSKVKIKTQTLTTIGLFALGVTMAAAAGFLLFGGSPFKNVNNMRSGYVAGYMTNVMNGGMQCVPGYQPGARSCEYDTSKKPPTTTQPSGYRAPVAGIQGYITPGYNGQCVPGYRAGAQSCSYRIPVRQPAGVQGYYSNGRCVPGYREDRQACTYR